MTRSLLLLAAFLGASSASAADLRDVRFGVNLGVSTLGPTIEPTARLDRFGLRAPIGAASLNVAEDSEGEEFEGSLDIGGLGLLADYFPFGNGFHLSAGLIRTDYGFDLAGEGIEIDGQESGIEVSIDQRRAVNPLFAMGYTGRLAGRTTLSVAAGAILGDGFDFEARDPSGTFTQAQIDEETQDLRDLADGLDVVPYIQLAVGFAF